VWGRPPVECREDLNGQSVEKVAADVRRIETPKRSGMRPTNVLVDNMRLAVEPWKELQLPGYE
jgi:hypothetical protein